jgi:vacuolar-type H+-ATPase subunit E/Vma4
MADLAALLDREASAEIEAISSEAQSRAAEFVAKAEADAQALLAQRERAAQGQHEAAMVRARSSAQLEASSLKLRAQQSAIESVFSDVEERLSTLAGDAARFGPVLMTLLREALDAIGGASAVRALVVNPADRELATEAASSLGLSAEVRTDPAVVGGVRLEGGRNVAIENTLLGRLDALRDDLAADVARALSGGSDA